MPTPAKPMSFRRWYTGNLFLTPSAWATCGRILVRIESVRHKAQRAFIAAPKRVRDGYYRPMENGDQKAAGVIHLIDRQSWDVPRRLGTHTLTLTARLGKQSAGEARDYTLFQIGDRIDAFEPCAVDWLLRHVRHDGLRIEPKRGTLWLVEGSEPVALLMPISLPAEMLEPVRLQVA